MDLNLFEGFRKYFKLCGVKEIIINMPARSIALEDDKLIINLSLIAEMFTTGDPGRGKVILDELRV